MAGKRRKHNSSGSKQRLATSLAPSNTDREESGRETLSVTEESIIDGAHSSQDFEASSGSSSRRDRRAKPTTITTVDSITAPSLPSTSKRVKLDRYRSSSAGTDLAAIGTSDRVLRSATVRLQHGGESEGEVVHIEEHLTEAEEEVEEASSEEQWRSRKPKRRKSGNKRKRGSPSSPSVEETSRRPSSTSESTRHLATGTCTSKRARGESRAPTTTSSATSGRSQFSPNRTSAATLSLDLTVNSNSSTAAATSSGSSHDPTTGVVVSLDQQQHAVGHRHNRRRQHRERQLVLIGGSEFGGCSHGTAPGGSASACSSTSSGPAGTAVVAGNLSTASLLSFPMASSGSGTPTSGGGNNGAASQQQAGPDSSLAGNAHSTGGATLGSRFTHMFASRQHSHPGAGTSGAPNLPGGPTFVPAPVAAMSVARPPPPVPPVGATSTPSTSDGFGGVPPPLPTRLPSRFALLTGRSHSTSGTSGAAAVAHEPNFQSFMEEMDLGRLHSLLAGRGLLGSGGAAASVSGNIGSASAGTSSSSRMHQMAQQLMGQNMSHGINHRIGQLQQAAGDRSIQLILLQEINQALLMGFEETLANLHVRELVNCILEILEADGEHLAELKNLSCNVLTHMMDVLPRSSDAVVPAIPLLLSTMTSSFVGDILERIINVLEQVSRRHGRAILQNGGIATVLNFYDFVTATQHRTILTMVSNCFVNLVPDDFPLIADCLESLSERLKESEARCVERVCTCFARLVEAYQNDEALLKRIAASNLFVNLQHLLMASPPIITGVQEVVHMLGTMCANCPDLAVVLMRQNICETLHCLLAGTGTSTPAHQSLSGDRSSSAVVVSQAISSRSQEETYVIVNLIAELVPRLPTEGLFTVNRLLSRPRHPVSWWWWSETREWTPYAPEISHRLERAYQLTEEEIGFAVAGRSYLVNFSTMQQQNVVTGVTRDVKRLGPIDTSSTPPTTSTSQSDTDASLLAKPDSRALLLQEQSAALEVGCQYGDMYQGSKTGDGGEGPRMGTEAVDIVRVLFPLLLDVFSESSSPNVRYRCLEAMLRMIHHSSPFILEQVLNQRPISSSLASMLASTDARVVVGAIQMSNLLLTKLPNIFVVYFKKEGVVYQLDRLVDGSHSILVSPSTGPAVDSASCPDEANAMLVDVGASGGGRNGGATNAGAGASTGLGGGVSRISEMFKRRAGRGLRGRRSVMGSASNSGARDDQDPSPPPPPPPPSSRRQNILSHLRLSAGSTSSPPPHVPHPPHRSRSTRQSSGGTPDPPTRDQQVRQWILTESSGLRRLIQQMASARDGIGAGNRQLKSVATSSASDLLPELQAIANQLHTVDDVQRTEGALCLLAQLLTGGADLSPFEMQHSGLIGSVLRYLVTDSGSREARLRVFFKIFLKRTSIATDPSLRLDADELAAVVHSQLPPTPFFALIARLMASLHQQEQFQVRGGPSLSTSAPVGGTNTTYSTLVPIMISGAPASNAGLSTYTSQVQAALAAALTGGGNTSNDARGSSGSSLAAAIFAAADQRARLYHHQQSSGSFGSGMHDYQQGSGASGGHHLRLELVRMPATDAADLGEIGGSGNNSSIAVRINPLTIVQSLERYVLHRLLAPSGGPLSGDRSGLGVGIIGWSESSSAGDDDDDDDEDDDDDDEEDDEDDNEDTVDDDVGVVVDELQLQRLQDQEVMEEAAAATISSLSVSGSSSGRGTSGTGWNRNFGLRRRSQRQQQQQRSSPQSTQQQLRIYRQHLLLGEGSEGCCVELFIDNHRLLPEMPLYQAVRRFSPAVVQHLASSGSAPAAVGASEQEREEQVNHIIWNSLHTIHYRVVPNPTSGSPSEPQVNTSTTSASSNIALTPVSDQSTRAAALASSTGAGVKQKSPMAWPSGAKSGGSKRRKKDELWTEGQVPATVPALFPYLVDHLPCPPQGDNSSHAPVVHTPVTQSSPASASGARQQDNTQQDVESVYTTLALIRLLEAVNRLWYSLDGGLDPFPLLPQAEFRSAKLSAKANRQLQDVFNVLAGNLPSWLIRLITTCAFLFPFDTRQTFFYAYNFDRERTILRIQELNASEGEGSSSDRFPSQLKRQKVTVTRGERLLKEAERTLTDLRGSRAMLEIAFEGEAGFGLGPTLEFYTLISRELMRASLGLWHAAEVTDDGFVVAPVPGLYPRPLGRGTRASVVKEVRSKFTFVGRLLARALLDWRQLDLPLSPILFKWLLGQESSITPADLALVDPQLARSYRQLSALSDRKRIIENDPCLTQAEKQRMIEALGVDELCLTFVLPGHKVELMKNGSDVVVTADNLPTYLRLLAHWTLVEGVSRQMEAMVEGFDSVLPGGAARANLAALFQPDELEGLFCGGSRQRPGAPDTEGWDVRTLMEACCCDHGYTPSSRSIRHLFEIMAELGPAERRLFVQFVTGSPRLPVGGFRALKPPLKIVMKREGGETPDDHLPSVMTCQNYLKLPDYSSKEAMRHKLLYAIREGQNAFLLS